LLPISQYDTLFALIGTIYGGDGNTTFALPDLRGRTIIGASTADPVGTLVGSPTVRLANNQTPNGFTNEQPFDNREPSLALNYLIARSGTFPSRDSGSVDPTIPYLGEVIPFAGNFAPSGWALCNGQLLPINQNQALFALLGTTYGGNGITTFGLPDLRGRCAVHVAQGPGLSPYDLGQVGGTETVTLNTQQIAPHPHPANCLNATANQPKPNNNIWAIDAGGGKQYGTTKAAGTMAPNIIGPSGSGQAHNNIQPYLALNYCIALQGIFPQRP